MNPHRDILLFNKYGSNIHSFFMCRQIITWVRVPNTNKSKARSSLKKEKKRKEKTLHFNNKGTKSLSISAEHLLSKILGQMCEI